MRLALQRTNGNLPTTTTKNRTNHTRRQHDGMGMDQERTRAMTILERAIARNQREKMLLKQGRKQERERIIKLLEGEQTFSLLAFHVYADGNPEELAADLIASIKGEK